MFNRKTVDVLRKSADRYTSTEVSAFLTDMVITQPRGNEHHVIADNLSARKNQRLKEVLGAHPLGHLHSTPTHSSWPNQVELRFGKIERDAFARGVVTFASELKGTRMGYIRRYNTPRQIVKWTYANWWRRLSTRL